MSTLKVSTIQDITNSNNAMSIDANGHVTFPSKIAFMAKMTANQSVTTASRTKINFAASTGARAFQTGSCYDNTNYRFDAPVAGLYYFMASAYIASHSNTAYHILRFTLNDNATAIGEGYSIAVPNATAYQSQHIHCMVDMSAGDTLDCRTQSQSDTSYTIEFSNSHFSGFLIG